MPRTAVAVQEVLPQTNALLTQVVADAVNNNMFPNDGRTVLIVENPTAGALNITVVSVADQHGRTGDQVISIPATSKQVIGPLRQAIWNQFAADIGNVYVN